MTRHIAAAAMALVSAIALLSSPIHAAPVSNGITLGQLETAFIGNCPPATVGEAISCADALPFINNAINKYGLTTRGQRAAYIATMAYEGAYLKYDFNIVVRSQGTRSILPATSLWIFVDANKDIQQIWPSYPQIDNNLIAMTLVDNKKDFEPGAWWVKAGPGCANGAALLSDSPQSFQDWERTCIYGGVDTIDARTTIYQTVYNALT